MKISQLIIGALLVVGMQAVTAASEQVVSQPDTKSVKKTIKYWDTKSFEKQTEKFAVECDVTPNMANMNGLFGLTTWRHINGWAHLATIVRFNPKGKIDVRNGKVYQAENSMNYQKGVVYHIQMVVNVKTHTYSVYVTPAGGDTVTIGSDYAFRTKLNQVKFLQFYVNHSAKGTLDLKNFKLIN
ncbi:MAG: hypothetical protein L3J71_14540 [Victivallaceae bacterium]|nr:hypothetical protein [Victivallaceae bacterium]